MGEVEREGLGFETRAIHAGQAPDPTSGAVVPPISLSTTFAQEAVGDHKGYEYSRSGNPTRTALEVCLASLEGGAHGFAFASGLSAEDAVLRTLVRPGERILLGNDAYGGTFRLISKVYATGGVHVERRRPHRPRRARRVVARRRRAGVARDADQPAAHVHRHRSHRRDRPSPPRRAASSTTPSPRRTCSDRSSSARTWSCTRRRSTSAVTPTSSVASSLSTTSRSRTRCASSRTQQAPCRRRSTATSCSAGLKTLAVRMDRHCAQRPRDRRPARRPRQGRACALPAAPRPSGPRARRRSRCATSAGWCRSPCAGGEEAALEVVRRTELFTLAESLGAVESLIEHPGRMTHASAAGSPLQVDPALVRLSVGIESAADLVADLVPGARLSLTARLPAAPTRGGSGACRAMSAQ